MFIILEIILHSKSGVQSRSRTHRLIHCPPPLQLHNSDSEFSTWIKVKGLVLLCWNSNYEECSRDEDVSSDSCLINLDSSIVLMIRTVDISRPHQKPPICCSMTSPIVSLSLAAHRSLFQDGHKVPSAHVTHLALVDTGKKVSVRTSRFISYTRWN